MSNVCYYMWDGEIVLPSPLYTVSNLVKVSPGEVTCLACGQTYSQRTKRCPLCFGDGDGTDFYEDDESAIVTAKTTPTISYLMDDEYIIVK